MRQFGRLRSKAGRLYLVAMLLLLASTALLVSASPGKAHAEVSESGVLVSSAGQMLQYTDGSLEKAFNEGIFEVDGEVAYCVESERTFAAGTVTSASMLTIMSQETLTEVVLRAHYATGVYTGATLPRNARLMLAQTLIWDAQGGPSTYVVASAEEGGTFPELTSSVREDVVSGAKEYAAANASRFVGRGTLWVNGATQKVATLWLESATGDFDLRKASSSPQVTDGNPCYSLEGAVYGVFSDAGCTQSAGSVSTDASGYAKSAQLPAGRYYIKETSAPAGYRLDPAVHQVAVTGGETAHVTPGTLLDEPLGDRAFAVLSKHNAEAAWSPSGNGTLGACSLAGAQYTLDYYEGIYDSVDAARRSGEPRRTWVFETDASGVARFADPGSQLVSGTLYMDVSGSPMFPLGTYLVRETLPPAGYLASGAIRLLKVEQHGEGTVLKGDVDVVDGVAYIADAEQSKRGDITLTKVREADMARLANVPFKVTSETTGESHVIVTDENGVASTATGWNAHTRRTNANDVLMGVGGGVDGADGAGSAGSIGMQPDPDAGVWFGLLSSGGMVGVDDALCALPYDTYTVEELSCASNEGLELVRIEGVTVKRDRHDVNLGTVDDRSGQAPLIITSARDDATLSKSVCAGPQSRLVDHIDYMNLVRGEEYRVETWLVDAATGTPIEEASSSTTFVAPRENGSLDVAVEADLLGIAARRVVFFEALYQGGLEVASHEDADDSEQTLLVCQPAVSTSACDGADGDRSVASGAHATVVDTVHFASLVPGETYTLEGALMERSEGGEAAPFRDMSGNPVRAAVEFSPVSQSGSVDVALPFEAPAREEPFTLVAFERLLKDGELVASHEDAWDEAQSVILSRPEVCTFATDMCDGDKDVPGSRGMHVIDEVELTNLAPGQPYTLLGTVMDASTGLPAMFGGDGRQEARAAEFWDGLLEVLGIQEDIGADGASYSIRDGSRVNMDDVEAHVSAYSDVTSLMCFARTDFEAAAPSMSTSVDYAFDAEGAEGRFVIYDLLVSGDKAASVHADPASDAQSFEVTRPSIATEATDAADGDHTILPSMDAKVVDTVFYEGLVPGREYVLSGMLMDRAKGEELHSVGSPVKAEAAFAPQASAGSTTVEFRFDATSLSEGYELVAFEYLTCDGETVAEHASLSDALQTVRVAGRPAGKGYDKTGAGDGGPPMGAAIAGTGCAIACGLAFAARRRLLDAISWHRAK